jgi:hypothetical protein
VQSQRHTVVQIVAVTEAVPDEEELVGAAAIRVVQLLVGADC